MTDEQLELIPEKPFKVAWTANWQRHFTWDSAEFATPKEAWDFLNGSADAGYLCPGTIVKPDGTVIDVHPFGPNDDVWDSYEVFEKRFV